MSQYVSSMIKYAQSGDSFNILIKDNAKKITEKQFSLAYVECPRFRREGDEPFAFEAQEFSRRLVVGRPASVSTLYVIPTSKREYGRIRTSEFDLAESLLREGLAKLRPEATRNEGTSENSYFVSLEEAQDHAQQYKLGIWGPSDDVVVTEKANPANPAKFLKAHKGKKLNGIVETIRNGDQVRVRLFLSPKQHQLVTISLAGVRCPRSTFTATSPEQTSSEQEPCGDEAKQFVVTRLLQRNVVIELLDLAPNGVSFLGNVLHPAGNIATFLLSSGLGRVADNHISALGPETMQSLRTIERKAKISRLGIWKNISVSIPDINSLSLKDYSAVVSRVISTDTLEVRKDNGVECRIQLSSIRHPRPSNEKEAPYQLEAREFLRKKIIGKRVQVSLDFIRPGQNDLPAINNCTVKLSDGTNVALMVVKSGYATVIRYRMDSVDRSPIYDFLIEAEKAAQEGHKGMWSGKKPAYENIVNASESSLRSRQYLSSLQRTRKLSVIIENVISGSRFRCFCPKENCYFMFACAGIRTPRTARNDQEKGEPFAEESLSLAKSLLQHDAQVEILSVDNNGCFLGDIYVNHDTNFALKLLSQGLAWCQGYASQSNVQYSQYHDTEAAAKEQKVGMWHDYVPPEKKAASTEKESENTVKEPIYLDIVLSDIAEDGKFSFQIIGTGIQQLETLMSDLGSLKKSFKPSEKINVGMNVAAISALDNAMYRGRVLRCDRENQAADVLLYDYGSVEQIPFKNISSLPDTYTKLKPQAQLARLSYVQLPPPSSDYYEDARLVFRELAMNKGLVAKVDGHEGNVYSVTLYNPSDGSDFSDCINAQLVALGMASVIPKKKTSHFEKDIASLNILEEHQQEARLNHIGFWVYGDPLEYED
ncbi:RNA-binding protein Snd1 [Schizosaccharomyces pombe]